MSAFNQISAPRCAIILLESTRVSCPRKTEYDPEGRRCLPKRHNLLLGIVIGLSVGFGILLVCLSGVFLIRQWRNGIQKQLRKKYFQKNKGLLLEQLICSNEKPRIKFSLWKSFRRQQTTLILHNVSDMDLEGSDLAVPLAPSPLANATLSLPSRTAAQAPDVGR
uniref:Uncharacterized protein n=1 Tax=Oryza glumipatula TaxID=40148 RepID=A0A0D9ZJK0_9ORYZ